MFNLHWSYFSFCFQLQQVLTTIPLSFWDEQFAVFAHCGWALNELCSLKEGGGGGMALNELCSLKEGGMALNELCSLKEGGMFERTFLTFLLLNFKLWTDYTFSHSQLFLWWSPTNCLMSEITKQLHLHYFLSLFHQTLSSACFVSLFYPLKLIPSLSLNLSESQTPAVHRSRVFFHAALLPTESGSFLNILSAGPRAHARACVCVCVCVCVRARACVREWASVRVCMCSRMHEILCKRNTYWCQFTTQSYSEPRHELPSKTKLKFWHFEEELHEMYIMCTWCMTELLKRL